MNRIKYIVFSILILTGLLISGELYQSYSECFSDFYETSFYVQNGISSEKMLDDIYTEAEKHDVSVFFMDSRVENIFTRKTDIYCNDKLKSILINKYQLLEGTCGSIFSGSTTVNFHDYKSVPKGLIETNNPKYYLYGNFDDMVAMKQALVDVYGGKFPVQNDYSSLSESKNTLIAVWSIIVLLICFVSYYTLIIGQKEVMIRITMGESRTSHVIKNSLADAGYLIGFSFAAYYVLKKYTNVFFFNEICVTAITLTSVLIFLINTRIYRLGIKAAFSKGSENRSLTIGTYVIKLLSCSLSVILLTLQADVINESLQLYSQKEFFSANRNSSYLSIFYTDNVSRLDEQLYRKYSEKAIILDECIGYSDSDDDYAVLANSNSLSYLREWIPELKNAEISSSACLIIPESKALTESERECILSYLRDYGIDNNSEICEIIYSSDSSIITIDRNSINASKWCSSPVIILLCNESYDMLSDDEVYGSGEVTMYIRIENMIINAPADELVKAVEQYGCRANVTNVYEYYLYRWEVMKRTLYISTVFMILVILLEICINCFIIKLEYRFNSIELAVKKLLGYSNFERCHRMYVLSFGVIGVSTVICFIALYVLGRSSVPVSVASALIIAVIDIIIINQTSNSQDKKNIPIILKGGEL